MTDVATPRPDQEQALAAVAAWAAEPTSRGQLIEAPGTGKTLLAYWAAERIAPPLVIYAAPSLSLLDQTLRMWTAQQIDGQLQRLVVCSDTTVADDLPAARLAIPPTTDVAHIRAWLSYPLPAGTRRQVFVTYQSAARVGAILRELGTPAPLLLADEAHRLAAPGPSLFRAVLDDRLFPARRRLFLTGTPRVGRVLGPNGHPLEPELSLDDRGRFGPVLHRLSFADAIGLGLLADYELDVVVLTDPTIPAGALGDAAALLAAVAGDLSTGRIRRAFSFHVNRAAAEQFRRHLATTLDDLVEQRPFDGPWVVETVFGTHPVNARVATLEALRSRGGVIASVRALSEGIDLPELDAVLLVDPKRSTVDIAQSIGRALRRDPSNPTKRARIIVPVVASATPSADLIIDSDVWAPVWRVLSALAAHDERLANELARSTRYQAAQRARRRPPSEPRMAPALPLRFRLPVGFDEAELARAVSLAAVTVAGDPFEEGFGHLEAYVSDHGHASVPLEFATPDGFQLGRWVWGQLRAQALGRMALERVERLSALPRWKWSAVDPDWDLGYSVLRQFVRGHRHARVPLGWMDRRGLWLGSWVMSVRAAYHAGLLRPERTRLLEQLPGWQWGAPEASAPWRPHMTKRRPGRPRAAHGKASNTLSGTTWERAVHRAAQALPQAARHLGRGEAEHSRWAPSDAGGSRPSPLLALFDALLPYLHRWLGPDALKSLRAGLEVAWFPHIVTERRQYRAREAHQAVRGTIDGRLHHLPGALAPDIPEYGFALDHTDPSDAAMRAALPLMAGWAPPPMEQARQLLGIALQLALVRAAIPIAAGMDRRAVAFTKMLGWAQRRWGTPAEDQGWLTDRLQGSTFGDPSMRELWLGRGLTGRAAEHVLRDMISDASREKRRSHPSSPSGRSFRAALERAARRELLDSGRSLLARIVPARANDYHVVLLGELGSDVRVLWAGNSPCLRLPRHALLATRAALKLWPSRYESALRPLLVRARRDLAASMGVANACEAIWVRDDGKEKSVIESGLIVGQPGRIESMIVWPQGDDAPPSPARRPAGVFTWPLRQPADWAVATVGPHAGPGHPDQPGAGTSRRRRGPPRSSSGPPREEPMP